MARQWKTGVSASCDRSGGRGLWKGGIGWNNVIGVEKPAWR